MKIRLYEPDFKFYNLHLTTNKDQRIKAIEPAEGRRKSQWTYNVYATRTLFVQLALTHLMQRQTDCKTHNGRHRV